jgi:hypothetical protein
MIENNTPGWGVDTQSHVQKAALAKMPVLIAQDRLSRAD